MKKLASEFYRNRQGNCAQSVVVAWQQKNSINGTLVEELAGCGHGKAPDGVCGALHAVHRLIDKDSASRLDARFREASGGHTKCREIRASGKLSCVGCVEVAAELLDEHLSSMQNSSKS